MTFEQVEIVICMHPNNDKFFIFRAPENASKKLNVGDYVLCDTCNGHNQIAQCITPQFTITDFRLKQFYDVEINRLPPVTAYLKPVAFAFEPIKEVIPCKKQTTVHPAADLNRN